MCALITSMSCIILYSRVTIINKNGNKPKRVSGEHPSSSQNAFTTNLCSMIPEGKHCMESHFHIRVLTVML